MKASKLCTGILLGFLIVCFWISNQSVKAETVGGFEVTGGNQGTDYSYENNILKIKTGQQITIGNRDQSQATTDRIQIAEGVQADVILNNVHIAVNNGSAFELSGNSGATITLKEGSTNQLKTSNTDAAALQKDGTGTLTIQGTGTLEAEAKAGAGIGGSKTNQDVKNIIIQGNCMVTGKSESGAGIGAGEGGKVTENLQIQGESTIVKSSGKEGIVGAYYMRKDWKGLVCEKTESREIWLIYGASFSLDRDLRMDGGEFLLNESEKFEVQTGKRLMIGAQVVLQRITGRIYNNGIISHSSKEDFQAARIMPGTGVFDPRLQGKLRIAEIEKEYTGNNVQLQADFYDEHNQLVTRDYGGKYDGAADFKWYKDENGQAGELLTNNEPPKDVGVYHVEISAAEGNFFTVDKKTEKVVIKKAEPTVTVTAGPAIVNQKLGITANVTGVNGEQPTGKLIFKVAKGTDPSTDKEIAVNNGQAVFDWTPTEKGDYSVTVKYVPAADGTGKNYKESISAVFSLTVGEKGSNPGGNSQGGGSSSGGGSSISGNSSSSSNTINTRTDNKSKEEKKEQDKKEKQKESKKEPKSVFKDVKTKDKSYQAIKFTVDKGLLKEKNHKFHPSKKITAKDVVSALYKMAGKAENKKVSDKKDLVKAEAFLKETKILSEKDGDFVKAKEITKEQLIQLLYNYAEYKGYNTEVTGKLAAFKDSNKLSKRAEVAMTWALENGLITDKNNKLSPKNKVTRKELATILYNFLNKEETKKLNK